MKIQDIVPPNQKDCEMFALDEEPQNMDKSALRLLVVKSDLKIAFYEYDRSGKGQFVWRGETQKLQHRPSAVAWYGKNIFIGFEKRSYEVLDYDTKKTREIDCFKGYSLGKHMIKVVSEEETLFLGPNDFLIPLNNTSCDKLNQNPTQTIAKIIGISVLDPYIIVLGENKLQVLNKVYTKDRQRLLPEDAFEASGSNIGKGISTTSNKIFFATMTKVFYLNPTPYDVQIMKCLSCGHVEDALMIFNQYIGENDPDRQRKLDQLKIDAAWVYFRDLKFNEAETILKELNFDIKEFASLFWGLVLNAPFENKNNVTFSSISHDAMKRPSANNELKDKDKAIKAGRESLARLMENRRKYFLENYAKNLKEYPDFIYSENFSPFADDIRNGRVKKFTVEEHLEIIDFALLKVYMDLQREDLLGTLLEKKLFCKDRVKELEPAFCGERKPTDSILAKFYEQFGRYKEALDVWKKLLDSPEKSKWERACEEMIRILTTYALYFKESKEKDLLFDYLALALKKNSGCARNFFMKIDLKLFSADTIQKKIESKLKDMKFLNEILLEILVNEKKIEDDKFHTNLAKHYVEGLFNIRKRDVSASNFKGLSPSDENNLNDLRRKLNKFLRDPTARYTPESILSQIKDSWLIEEEIYLYGVIKHHNEALTKMLNLQMYNEAEQYCVEKQERLLTKLFRLYIKKYNEYNEYLRMTPDDDKVKVESTNIKKVISRFLKKYASHSQLDPAAVVNEIPDDWTLVKEENDGIDDEEDDDGVFSFLFYSLSYTLHSKRNAKVAKYLSKLDHLDTQYKLLKAQSAHVTINSSRKCALCNKVIGRCALCNKVIGRAMFVVYPNGVITHHTCSQDKFTICPVTKQNFEKTFSG